MEAMRGLFDSKSERLVMQDDITFRHQLWRHRRG